MEDDLKHPRNHKTRSIRKELREKDFEGKGIKVSTNRRLGLKCI